MVGAGRAEKRLAAISLAASIPPSLVIGLISGDAGFQAGYRLASGGRTPHNHFRELVDDLLSPAVILAAIACAMVSAFAWWRLSIRQDELFNRIQNHALGHSAAWGVAAALLWWFLALAGLVGAFPLGWFLILVLALLYYFWFSGVRRWA